MARVSSESVCGMERIDCSVMFNPLHASRDNHFDSATVHTEYYMVVSVQGQERHAISRDWLFNTCPSAKYCTIK